MELVVFLVLAIGALGSAINVVLGKSPTVAGVNLVSTFLCLAGIYLLIGFPFLAALQVMVYAGAIMVLILFVIMLLDLRREEPGIHTIASLLGPVIAACIAAFLALILPGAKISQTNLPAAGTGDSASKGGLGLAESLFGTNLILFEITSVLLLVGIIGVVVLAKRQHKSHAERIQERLLAAEGGESL